MDPSEIHLILKEKYSMIGTGTISNIHTIIDVVIFHIKSNNRNGTKAESAPVPNVKN